MSNHWYPTPDEDAQTAHVLAGCVFVLATVTFTVLSPLWGLVFTACWVLPKEFVFDIFVEGDSVFASTKDAVYYLAGAFLSLVAVGLWA